MKNNLKIIAVMLVVMMMLMNLAACENAGIGTGEGTTTAETLASGDNSTPVDMKAAMCKVDITPDSDVLTGYSEGEESIAKYPDDFLTSIMARILILEVNGERILHLNAELPYIGFGSTTSIGFKRDLAKAAGTEAVNVFVSSTHNHQSNPFLDEEQEAAIIAAVQTAAENLVPVKLGVDTYGTEYGISRSPAYGQSFETPYDNTVTVLRFDHAETGAPVGMIYCVPIHNTAFGSTSPDNWHFLNCEFTGFTSRYIEEKFADNADFTAIHFIGFTGNAGPYFPDVNRWYSTGIRELEVFGGDFGEEILGCYNNIVCEDATDIAIKIFKETYSVQRAANLTEEIQQYWGESATSEIILNTFSLGDIAYMEIPAEPFATIGAHLRAESPFEYLVAVSVINHGYTGYIPLRETYLNEGEQETTAWKTPFDETGGEQFFDCALDALCKLKGVTYERTVTTQTSAEEADGKRIYTFEFAEEITPDKLVISFDQSSRFNCAEDFVLEVFDKAGNKTHTIQMKDNSVNYLGFSMEDVKAAKVVLTVSSTYRSLKVADIKVSVHAMNYTPVE